MRLSCPRLAALVAGIALMALAPAFAQTRQPDQHPYGLDPYKPSDAELLRRYGSALLAQTPLTELRKLDPYKPSEAALLREFGGAIPAWAVWYPLGPVPGPYTPFTAGSALGPAPPPNVVVLVVPQPPADAAARAPAASAPSPTAVATTLRPETNDGVWIGYAGQRWISAGRAVPFEQSRFMRVGQYGEFGVFKRRGVDEDVIYLPTRDDLVAPYRLKR